MKLNKDTKKKIDDYFESKTPEELEHITSKYVAGIDPYKEDTPVQLYEQLPGRGSTTFQIILNKDWYRKDDPTLGDLLNEETPSD